MALKSPSVVFAAVLLVGSLVGCYTFDGAESYNMGAVKDAFVESGGDLPSLAPAFNGIDVVTGLTVSLDQFKGQAVLLSFLDYGCSTDLNEVVSAQLRSIRELRQQRDDFLSVSIFCGCCPADVLRDFATRNNLLWPWILDSDYNILQQYSAYLGDSGYPILVFIEPHGTIIRTSGNLATDDLSKALDAAVATPEKTGRVY